MATYESVGYNSPDGMQVGNSATTTKVGFFGVTPVVQPTNAAQAALTITTGTAAGYGFTTSTGYLACMAQIENIRASLVTLGLLKGS